jgi:hypothetical protein
MSFLQGRVKKQQTFTSSGTFTPSSALLIAGGWVEVELVGGGGGGSADSSRGGGGGQVVKNMVQVTAPVTVTIGAGGGWTAPGGSSAFGSLVSASGGYPSGQCGDGSGVGNAPFSGGNGAGGAGSVGLYNSSGLAYTGAGSGGTGLYGFGGGGGGYNNLGGINSIGSGSCGGGSGNSSGVSNTGGGGGGYYQGGGSGVCIVTWWE